jgi:Fe-S-cluster containining protein
MSESLSAAETIRQLCLRCGICCNGVLFRDVELQARDDPLRLRALGLPLQKRRADSEARKDLATALSGPRRWRLPQPCSALGPDGRCRVYPDRPSRCRAFECVLFKEVQAGRRELLAGLRVIRAALDQADRIKNLLRQLGDTEESLALSLRFQRMQKAMGSRRLPGESAALYANLRLAAHESYAELTLAVHDLNLILGREFHP